jgi:uncharacterized protein YkwD
MHRLIESFLAFGMLVNTADEKPFAPTSPTPAIAFVDSIDAEKGVLGLLRFVAKPVCEVKYELRRKEIDGRIVTEKVPVTAARLVTEKQRQDWSAKDGKAMDAKGTALSMADLAKRLKKNNAVLVAIGERVDPSYLTILRADAVILLAPLPPEPPPPPVPSQTPTQEPTDLSDVEEQVIELVNTERRQAEIAALRPNAMLMKAARSHSQNMASQDTLSHELDGQGPGERLESLGYRSFGVAENCGAGQRTPAEVVETWMNSQGHRANILGENYRDVGIGMAKTTRGKTYWTLLFATPAN